jgi:hypothetical protein
MLVSLRPARSATAAASCASVNGTATLFPHLRAMAVRGTRAMRRPSTKHRLTKAPGVIEEVQ